jgi:hypothetical protein
MDGPRRAVHRVGPGAARVVDMVVMKKLREKHGNLFVQGPHSSASPLHKPRYTPPPRPLPNTRSGVCVPGLVRTFPRMIFGLVCWWSLEVDCACEDTHMQCGQLVI